MKDMKTFYWKLLLWQTVFYGSLYFIGYMDNGNNLTTDSIFFYKPFVLIAYSISVLFTFIIPMIKQFKNK